MPLKCDCVSCLVFNLIVINVLMLPPLSFSFPSLLKALENAKAEKRLRFTSAVFHHLSAIKIQRALRAHRALENAKRQIHCVVTIQVQLVTSQSPFRKNILMHLKKKKKKKMHIGEKLSENPLFFCLFLSFLVAVGESEASEEMLPGRQAQGADGPASGQALAGAPPPSRECHPAGRPEVPPPQAPEDVRTRRRQSSGAPCHTRVQFCSTETKYRSKAP